MKIRDLASVLRADALNVVVFGPGFGESIAVGVPPGEWLVIDSLGEERGERLIVPAVELLDELQVAAQLVVLTHPHDDHVGGFDRLLDHGHGTRLVGAVDAYGGADDFSEAQSPRLVLKGAKKRTAVNAIRTIWREEASRKWELVAPTKTPLGLGAVEVLHPSTTTVAAVGSDPSLGPNPLSAPLLVRWEAARVVLGADLDSAHWVEVMAVTRTPPLYDYAILKIAHHGSRQSQNEDLLTQVDAARTWALTPWFLGGGVLPDLEPGGGAEWLLQRIEELVVTSPGRALTSTVSGPISRSALQMACEVRIKANGMRAIRGVGSPIDDAWAAFSFGSDGSIEGRWFGDRALVLTQETPS